MRNRILEIVVFLMDYMRKQADHNPAPDDISLELKDLGYSEQEIDTAYKWFLDQYNSTIEEYYSDFPDYLTSTRILTEEEMYQISPEAHGFLLKLLNTRILDSEQFETIIERIILLSGEQINLEQMKLIVSSVIFGASEQYEVSSMFDDHLNESSTLH
ncbi:MAG: DUF494 family protein [Calditrichaeota bacterium]|nr:MAG: DUF494 family protein [Calditrichota bacterium]